MREFKPNSECKLLVFALLLVFLQPTSCKSIKDLCVITGGLEEFVDIWQLKCKLALFYEAEVVNISRVDPKVFAYLGAAAGHSTLKLHPNHPKAIQSLRGYEEDPLTVLVGIPLYFCTLSMVLLVWYIRKMVWKSLQKTADQIQLYPKTHKFPRVNLYSLQQSRREARLHREVRNTWAWMANKYLLMEKDPNINVDVFKTTWADFDIPKDEWGVVRAIMRVNGMFTRIRNRDKNATNSTTQGDNKVPDAGTSKIVKGTAKDKIEAEEDLKVRANIKLREQLNRGLAGEHIHDPDPNNDDIGSRADLNDDKEQIIKAQI